MIAFSYRPIQSPTAIELVNSMRKSEPYYTEIEEAVIANTVKFSDDVPRSRRQSEDFGNNIDFSSSKPRKRNTRSRITSKLDLSPSTSLRSSPLNASDFLRDVSKGHTLLGLASFEYAPKANAVDFIEDLALAGIRFCFFSAAPERESKAYAERLGV